MHADSLTSGIQVLNHHEPLHSKLFLRKSQFIETGDVYNVMPAIHPASLVLFGWPCLFLTYRAPVSASLFVRTAGPVLKDVLSQKVMNDLVCVRLKDTPLRFHVRAADVLIDYPVGLEGCERLFRLGEWTLTDGLGWLFCTEFRSTEEGTPIEITCTAGKMTPHM